MVAERNPEVVARMREFSDGQWAGLLLFAPTPYLLQPEDRAAVEHLDEEWVSAGDVLMSCLDMGGTSFIATQDALARHGFVVVDETAARRVTVTPLGRAALQRWKGVRHA